MHKYEIMLIINPKFDISNVEKLANEIFSKDLKKFEKMEQTELAYPINGENIGIYLLLIAETSPENINEFRRRASIEKNIWRKLIINLDTDKVTIKHKKRFNYNKDNKNPKNTNDKLTETKEIKVKKRETKEIKVKKRETKAEKEEVKTVKKEKE